jgi:hypothetical protein
MINQGRTLYVHSKEVVCNVYFDDDWTPVERRRHQEEEDRKSE